jgi:hypothetical protein
MTIWWTNASRGVRILGMRQALPILLVATLAACGGDNGGGGGTGGGGGNTPTYTVGGAVTGLAGSGLQLRNGTTDLAITANGMFTFPGAIASGTAYSVTVTTQPSSPAQVCTVTAGSGTVATSNVTNIAVTCTTSTTSTYTVGGTVSGLNGSGLTLNDGTDDLAISANGAFTFPSLASGIAYNVTVVKQPSGPAQVCTVTSGSGTVGTSNVTGIAVACATPPLNLSSSMPSTGATGVSRSFAPVLTFSLQLDANSVTTSTVTLVSATGASSAITLQVASNQITVKPTSMLAPLTSYTLTVGTGVQGSLGEPLASAISVTFTTSDKSWQTAGVIENNDGAASAPQIAVNASGHAVAVWTQKEGTITRIWSNLYTPGSGWGTAVPILADITNSASAPQVAIDAQGNALAVWVETYADGRTYLESNRYTPADGWTATTAQTVETDNVGDASDPQIALDGSGNAMLVWTRVGKIWASGRPSAGSGWAREVEIEPANAGTVAAIPQLAVNASGAALVVWKESNFDRDLVLSNRYTPGSGWGTVASLQTSQANDEVKAPQIATDANGNALVVWQLFRGTGVDLLANRYTAGSGWLTARSITGDKTHDVTSSQIAVDTNGNALAVWTQAAPSANSVIWYNRYPATATDWGTAATIGPIVAFSDLETPQIAFDANGNATAVWVQYISGQDKAYNIMSSLYTADGKWGAAELIETDDSGNASVPQVGVSANGNAVAVWQQSDGTRTNIVANRLE